ncbi:MAG: sensor histidine kinase [Gemmatimonadota bacterium]
MNIGSGILHVAPRHRSLAAVLGLVLLANTLIAALLTLAAPDPGGFGRNLLFAQCIGLAIMAWALLAHLTPMVRRLSARRAMVLTLLAATPLGVVTGLSLGYTLLGEPVQLLSNAPGRLVALLAAALASALLGYLVWMRQRLATEAAAREHAQRLAAEAELRLLRAQLEPHMLFNTLANLRSLIDDDPAMARSMLDQLIVYLRAALAASRSEWTTLEQEFAQLRAYLDIMTVRLGSRLGFEMRLPAELRDTRVPPMLLQPLVENALVHGIEPKVGGGRVTIVAERIAATEVEVVVADTGLGIGDQMEDRAGYGLAHVRERLRSVFGARATLALMPNLPMGTRAAVRFPA